MFSLGVLFFIFYERLLRKNRLLNKKMEKIKLDDAKGNVPFVPKRRNEKWKKIGLTKVLNKQKKS